MAELAERVTRVEEKTEYHDKTIDSLAKSMAQMAETGHKIATSLAKRDAVWECVGSALKVIVPITVTIVLFYLGLKFKMG